MAQYVLEILDGDRQGDVVSLAASLRIGRRPGNDLVIADEKASGVHAEVVQDGDRYVLKDLGSTNGTMLDGRRITEVVLNPGDEFSIGRVRLRFRDAEAAAGAASGSADAGDPSMAMGRFDASRLQAAKSKSSSALMVVLLLVVAGAGGYVWWRGQSSSGDGAVAQGPKGPLQVADNKLAEGACEGDQGWNLRLAGKGFVASGRAHTGSGGFEAVAAEQEPDFAVATSTQDITVLANRTMQLAAHVRTEGGGRVAARLHFFSSVESNPFHFRCGTALQSPSDWTRIEAAVAVPPEADRCRVEMVAALPKGGAVMFDDVAIVDGAQGGELVQRKPEESAGTLLGTGASIAIRSMDKEEPATLLGVLPGAAPAGLAGLLDQGLLALSDLGAKLTVDGDARSCAVAVEGVDALQLLFTSESANSLMVKGDSGFQSVAAAGEYATDALLLGDRATRCLVTLAQKATLQGKVGGGQFKLTVPANKVTIALGFRKERQEAQELLRLAREAAQQGSPGKALDQLRELGRKLPHDAEVMAQAATLRSDLQAAVAEQVRVLGVNLDEAEFFSTRGGFDRVVRGLDAMTTTYGEQNLPDAAAVAALRKRAADRLAQFDLQRATEERERLQMMAKVFELAQRPVLAALVRDYITRHLPGN